MGFNEVKGIRLIPQNTLGLTSNKGEMYYHSTLGVFLNNGTTEQSIVSDVWPTYSAVDEASLSNAISAAVTTGGVICVRRSFAYTLGPINLPSNTILVGRSFATNLTLSGTNTINMSSESQIRDITLTKSSGMTTYFSNSTVRATIKNVRFSGNGTVIAFYMSAGSSGNRVLRCQFVGGVTTQLFGSDNINEDSAAY